MKKSNLIIIAIIIIILVLIGFFFFAKKGQAPGSVSQDGKTGQEQQATSAIKDSLLGLMQGVTGVKCSVSDAAGSYTVVAKSGKVRIDGIGFANPSDQNQAEKPGTMINDGTWTYMWSGKEGMKFNLKELEAASGTQSDEVTKNSNWQDWAKDMESSGAKYDCKPGLATDSDFTPPADVKFQDWGEMFKALQQMKSNPGAIDPNQFKVP